MPVLKSAKKKLRRDIKKTKLNNLYRKRYKKALKKDINVAYSEIDKALKKRIIHKNKAARLKSRVAKRIK